MQKKEDLEFDNDEQLETRTIQVHNGNASKHPHEQQSTGHDCESQPNVCS